MLNFEASRFILAFTNNNQTILLDSLTGQFQILANPFPSETIQVQEKPGSLKKSLRQGICMLETKFVVYSPTAWKIFDLKCKEIEANSHVDVQMFVLK